MSAFFNNDGAALILTPIVVAVLISLRFSPATTLAFVMAAGFIADTASLPLIILLTGFFLLEPLGIPVSALAACGALILLAIARYNRKIATVKILRQTPWQIIIFSLGMYLVVYGLRNVGLTRHALPL